MSKIEQAKSYVANDAESIFFRPMLTGPSAEALGIRVLYNMPMPTTLNFWRRSGDVLQKFKTNGWSGGSSAERYQKSIEMSKVKAEASYSAIDYYSLVYEQICNRADINMQDLSGTELEKAETELFREAIAESIRATMWVGDINRTAKYNTFDGFIKRIHTDALTGGGEIPTYDFGYEAFDEPNMASAMLDIVWASASEHLRSLKSEGNLVFFVTGNIYNAYEAELDNSTLEAAYLARQNGRASLCYRGIPVENMQIGEYLRECGDQPEEMVILTDRRNLALAVNTADFPGTEVSMWYNPDEMENRQRAVFMAGCDYLLPELVSYAYIKE